MEDQGHRRRRTINPLSRELNSLRDYLPPPASEPSNATASAASTDSRLWSEGGDILSSRSSVTSSDLHLSHIDFQPDDSVLVGEANAFLDDLNNYLALGCLCYEDFTQSDDPPESLEWREISNQPPMLAFDNALATNLERLAIARWIRLFCKRGGADQPHFIIRIYILPMDVGLKYVDRRNKRLHGAVEGLVADVDVSEETWSGSYNPIKIKDFDLWASPEEGSLFWMFNKIPSPAPSAGRVNERYASEALEDVLDPAAMIPGLKTQLYPYQRRSAGLMLQREAVSDLELDPRLEHRVAPDGTAYYYGARDLAFLRHPRYYEACRGGILAETMGLGKTVICLAIILATQHHPPRIPDRYNLPSVRSSTASLVDMAVSSIHRKSIPWKLEMADFDLTGNFEKLKSPPTYELPLQQARWNRMTLQRPPRKMLLANTTIIIAPSNLIKQWLSEIQKHTDGALCVLTMDSSKTPLPSAEDICSYDIVLFSRTRFEAENKDGADDQGRRMGTTQRQCRCPYIGSSRMRDCSCLSTTDLYDSPLKTLHIKRLIIDEGHFVGNTSNTAVSVANKLITSDARWVVSGTPAKDLLGVEVDMTSSDNLWRTPNTAASRDGVLELRRHFSVEDDSRGAIKAFGALATNFLRIKPWHNGETSEESAVWDDHVFRHESLRKRTYSGFSSSLRRVLNSMVVKTQPHDVEKNLQLPPLSHEVVRLCPSFYDKLTANLFTLVLTANAVTSERTDVDYLFHKNSQKARSQLIANLRQSAFFWTGFSEADVRACVRSSRRYFGKHKSNYTKSDQKLLMRALKTARPVLASSGWKALSRSHEVGLFVEDWPDSSAEYWSFDGSQSPLLTGISQLLTAQTHVNAQIANEDPGEGLSGAGIRAVAPAKYVTVKKEEPDSPKAEKKQILTKSGIPSSSIDGEPVLRRTKSSPKKAEKAFKVTKPEKKKREKKTKDTKVKRRSGTNAKEIPEGLGELASRTATPVLDGGGTGARGLSPDSPYSKTRIVGTTSAKLSYLISQIRKHQKHEKILVFYDGENAAYYIAQMLELLNVQHLIYAKSLPAHLKSEYVVRFNQEDDIRVLLMDVRNAAHGLNLASASRIYFVNPICRPNIEAQAIKRAHRIGQTKPVYVETLVLQGSIEEKMLERSKRMSKREHRDASHLEDDVGIREIIQSARVHQISEAERTGRGQMAPLESPQQLWSRDGYEAFLGRPVEAQGSKKKRKMDDIKAEDDLDNTNARNMPESGRSVVRRTLAFVDCSEVHQYGSPYDRPGTPESPEISDISDIPDIPDIPEILEVPGRSKCAAPSPLRSLRDPFMPSMSDGRPTASSDPQHLQEASIDPNRKEPDRHETLRNILDLL